MGCNYSARYNRGRYSAELLPGSEVAVGVAVGSSGSMVAVGVKVGPPGVTVGGTDVGVSVGPPGVTVGGTGVEVGSFGVTVMLGVTVTGTPEPP